MNQTYQLSFTKARAMAVIASLCLLIFVTFTGGLAIGLGVRMPTRTEIALASQYHARSTSALPAEPNQQTPELQELEAAGTDRFSLQIGSFADANNAKQLETELKDRGYPVRVSRAIDPEKRVWHVVRVGDYADVITATRAAAEFTSREQLQAVVCRAETL